MSLIMRFVFILLWFSLILAASVNPFVVFNSKNIHTPQTVIPLPSEQIIWMNSKDKKFCLISDKVRSTIFIEPYESLIIVPSRQINTSIFASKSLDGRLYEENILIKNKHENYVLYNKYSKTLAVSLSSNIDINASLYTTLNTSVLNTIKGTEISLPGKYVSIVSPLTSSELGYYRFEKKKKFKFNVKGPGTLQLTMRSALPAIKNMNRYRQRISVAINDDNVKVLESLNGSSFSYIDSLTHKTVTHKTRHYIPLTKQNNTVEIETNSDILLRANMYYQNVINPMNDMNLSWTVPDSFHDINQPVWLNTNINDGLKRRNSIYDNKKYFMDSFQKKALEQTANISTFMKPLYPTITPKGAKLYEANYAIRTLYTSKKYDKVSTLSSNHELAYLHTLKSATFVDVPSEYKGQDTLGVTKTLEKFYFKTRAYKLDKGLKRKVKTMLEYLGDYQHIYINGYTDTTASKAFNAELSLKRSKSIKSELMLLGVPEEKISISFSGEENLLIPTSDEMSEASNRRVEIKVRYSVPQYEYLEYQFDKELTEDTELEITVSRQDKEKIKLYVYVNNKHFKTLDYKVNKTVENRSFSRGLASFSNNSYQYSSNVLATLKNTYKKPLLADTGTTIIILPKGTKNIRLARAKNVSPYQVALRIRASSIYKDTPYAQAHEYRGTFKNFFDSLHQKQLKNKIFNAWYEHTHPLRLWFLGKIEQAYNNIDYKDVAGYKALELAKTLVTTDIYTAIKIAKHILLLNRDKKLQESAYELLLKLSQTNEEKLIWHSAYFYKTKSSTVLKNIATLLKDEGQLELALNILLLLNKDDDTSSKICELALAQNKIKLYEYICENKKFDNSDTFEEGFIKKKSLIIANYEKQEQFTNKNIKVNASLGIETIYNKKRDADFNMYISTAAQPLKMEFDGPLSLKLDIRFTSKMKHYQWMRVEHNKEVYHYPLMQYKPSITLKTRSADKNISRSNILKLDLGEGKHILTIHAYENPVLVGIKSHPLALNKVKPLYKQILKTSKYNASFWKNLSSEITVPYASALLWNYIHGALDYKYHAQAQAYLLFNRTSSRQIKSILRPVFKYSSFVTYITPESTLGFKDITVPGWNPQSNIEKNRLPLLEGLASYDVVLHGSDIKVIHVSGNQRLTLKGQQFTPKFSIDYPLRVGFKIDNLKEQIIYFNKEKNWLKHFDFPKGDHSLKIRLIEPFSTQYFAFNMYENMTAISREKTQRYYATSYQDPIIIHEMGPKLLRIEKYNTSAKNRVSYVYLPKSKIYHYKILPSSLTKESLVHISRLEHDLLKKSSVTPPDSSSMHLLLSDKKREYSSFSYVDDVVKLIPIESHKPTLSGEIKFLNQEIGSEDERNRETRQTIQIGGYFRSQFSENSYVRLHYFSKLYENSLYGFKHKLYTDIPFLDNTSAILAANGYIQEDNNYWFKNLHLKSEVFTAEPLGSGWYHEYGLGAFKYFLDYNNLNSDLLDPLVYSQYKRDHQYGIYGMYRHIYQPYDDLRFSVRTRLQSNEELNTIDNFKVYFTAYHHIHPFDIRLFYNKWYYFKDQNRAEDYDISRIGGRVRFEKFVDTDRLQLDAGVRYRVEDNSMEFVIGLIWHYGHNKRFYNFMPDEKIFNSLRLRLEDEEK